MCGIVGYVGPQAALEVVMAGLKRLEYRGYDSAGVSVLAVLFRRSRAEGEPVMFRAHVPGDGGRSRCLV